MHLSTQTFLPLETCPCIKACQFDVAWPVLTDGAVQSSVPPAAPAVRHQQGQELHRGRGPLPRVHAASARVRQGERVRRTPHRRQTGPTVPLRLVHQESNCNGAYLDRHGEQNFNHADMVCFSQKCEEYNIVDTTQALTTVSL